MLEADDERSVGKARDGFGVARLVGRERLAGGVEDRRQPGVGQVAEVSVRGVEEGCLELSAAVADGKEPGAVRRDVEAGEAAEAAVGRAQVEPAEEAERVDAVHARVLVGQDHLSGAHLDRAGARFRGPRRRGGSAAAGEDEERERRKKGIAQTHRLPLP